MTTRRYHTAQAIRHALILAGTLGFALPAGAASFYVNASATCAGADGSAAKPFCTIQAGVGKAATGDTVQVAAGTYYEDVSISNKGLRILGADPATTVVQGFSSPFTVSGFSTAASVEIAGFTVTGGSGNGVGFGSANLTGWVHNCIIVGNPSGIAVWGGANIRVNNNVITGSSYQAVYVATNSGIAFYSNILMNSGTGAFADGCNQQAPIYSSYNRYFGNGTNRRTNCGDPPFSSTNDSDNSDPKLVDPGNGDYHLQPGSPNVDAGRPGAVDKDPDGSRNDQGVYGGPGAIAFWPNAAGMPVVTGLSSSPHDVAVGGTFTITGTGKAQ